MKPTRKPTSFGEMLKIELPERLSSHFEVMTFRKSGKPHAHEQAEVAVLLSGSGTVRREGMDDVPVFDGGWVIARIPAGVKHWMEPGDDGMTMLIVYHEPVSA